MDCRCFALQVDDWLDGRLNVAERQAMLTMTEPPIIRGWPTSIRAAFRTTPAPLPSRIGNSRSAAMRRT